MKRIVDSIFMASNISIHADLCFALPSKTPSASQLFGSLLTNDLTNLLLLLSYSIQFFLVSKTTPTLTITLHKIKLLKSLTLFSQLHLPLNALLRLLAWVSFLMRAAIFVMSGTGSISSLWSVHF